eukprot:1834050-Rhodomonas_salina.1
MHFRCNLCAFGGDRLEKIQRNEPKRVEIVEIVRGTGADLGGAAEYLGGTGEVFDEDPEKPLDRPENGAVDHDRALAAAYTRSVPGVV